MIISATNEIQSDLSADELKDKFRESYETKDTLKYEEFDPKYKEWPEWLRTSVRSTSINSPNTHYLGRFYQGNFELTSPRILYWRNVLAYVRYANANSKLVIELEYFKLVMIPLFIIWAASLLNTLLDPISGLPFFVISSLILGLMVIKAKNTLNYFKKYTR